MLAVVVGSHSVESRTEVLFSVPVMAVVGVLAVVGRRQGPSAQPHPPKPVSNVRRSLLKGLS